MKLATAPSTRLTGLRPNALATAQRAVVACDRCPRLRNYCKTIGETKRRAYQSDTYWARPVPGFGDPGTRLLIVGLAPAAHGANRTGRVFTGDGAGGSRDLLMAALHRAGRANLAISRRPDDGLRLTDTFIAAAVRGAPPANKPTPAEIRECLCHLDAEISALPGITVTVALGRVTFDACLHRLRRSIAIAPRPRFTHATVVELPNGQALMACYHPSRQNTHTGKLTPQMLDDVLQLVRRRLPPVVIREAGR